MRNVNLCGVVQWVREAGFLFVNDSMRLEFDGLQTRGS
jgi:hypothetical protein